VPAEQKLLVVGKVIRPHGIAGEVKVQVMPGYGKLLASIRRIYLGDGRRPRRVLSCRPHQGALLLKLERVASRDDAEALRGAAVLISPEDLPSLPAGAYYPHQLIGLRVLRTSGEEIGRLSEILRTGSNDVYVVQKASGQLLLPALESVVRSVDLATGTMVVDVPAGLE
jgi:16S rRNA processing protein RimM